MYYYGYNSQDYLDDRVGMNTSPSVGEMKIKGLKMHLVDGPTKGLNQASCFLTKPIMGPILYRTVFLPPFLRVHEIFPSILITKKFELDSCV